MRRLALLVTIAMFASRSNVPVHARAALSLTLDSWREGDQSAWAQIISDFQTDHPEIGIAFRPYAATSFDGDIALKFRNGTAGDLVACRPFDSSKTLFLDGYLMALGDLPGLSNFDVGARHPWQADDGTPYCVPIAFILHGFVYNRSYFDANGLTEPRTYEDLQVLLARIKDKGMTPLAMGSRDGPTVTNLAFDMIGPNLWNGEIGRLALIAGQQKYTDPAFVSAFASIQGWRTYLPDNHAALTPDDARALFVNGQAAIYPTASNDASALAKTSFGLDVFHAPAPRSNGSVCWLQSEPEMGIGLNALSPNLTAAREFLAYVTTERFARLYAKLLPGYFPLQAAAAASLAPDDPLMNRFLAFRNTCQITLPLEIERLSANHDHPLKADLGRVNALLLQGAITPQVAAQTVQKGMDTWYVPPAHP